MNIILEIIKEVIPAILTGIISWGIASYTQRKDIPLERMEISYNRVYYPIAKFLRTKMDGDINHVELKNMMNRILKKYDKYISQSTIYTYNLYLENHNSKNSKKYLENFENNVFTYNCKMRRILGYPQTSFFEAYFYADKKAKRVLNVCLALLLIYISALVYQFFPEKEIMVFILMLTTYLFFMLVLYVLKKMKNMFRLLKSFRKKEK